MAAKTLTITIKGMEEIAAAARAMKEVQEKFKEAGLTSEMMTKILDEGRQDEEENKKERRPMTHKDLISDFLDEGDETMTAKRRKKTAVSPFKKGRAEKRTGRGGFVTVKEGDPLTFAPLVGLEDMISADMHEYWDIKPAIYHPCIGRNCPGCKVKNEPRFKAYLPILLKSGETAVYPFTISVYNQLEALEDSLDEGESLAGFAIKVSRKGQMKATRYTVLGLGKRIDITDAEIPDYVGKLGPQTEKEIWALLEENGFSKTAGETDVDADDIDDDPSDKWGSA